MAEPPSRQDIYIGEMSNMCILLWHTSGLFSSYKALNMGEIIQYVSDE